LKIVIPGNPVPQARMKHARRGNFVTTYDPKAAEKKDIRHTLQIHVSSLQNNFTLDAYKNPRISFVFHMPIPSGIRKRDVALYNSGLLKHDKKPDVDNLAKLYLDCMDGIIFSGDQKVSLGPGVKLYHPEPKTNIYIYETDRMLTKEELDYSFLSESELCELLFLSPGCPFGLDTRYARAYRQFLDSSCPENDTEP
jgi:Holliday junction resolvase RusA-like endonuclease